MNGLKLDINASVNHYSSYLLMKWFLSVRKEPFQVTQKLTRYLMKYNSMKTQVYPYHNIHDTAYYYISILNLFNQTFLIFISMPVKGPL